MVEERKCFLICYEVYIQFWFGGVGLFVDQHSKIVPTFKVSVDLKLKIVLTSNLKQKNGFIDFK